MPEVNGLCLGAIEEQPRDFIVPLQKGLEIIGDDCAVVYIRIKATASETGLKHIPQSYTAALEQFSSLRVFG